MANVNDYDLTDYIFKVLLIGDKNVGKSSILKQYVNNEFDAFCQTTIFVDYYTVTLQVNGKIVKLNIWDTAGEEKYHAVTDVYYRNAAGVILVYDQSSKQSFDNVSKVWLEQVQRKAPEDCEMMLLGNKSDQTTTVPECDPSQLASLYSIPYYPTSAKLGSNVSTAFQHLATTLVRAHSAYDDVVCDPGSMPSFALHSFQPHHPCYQEEEGVCCYYA